MKVILADFINIESNSENSIHVISFQTFPNDTILDLAISARGARKICRELLTNLAQGGDDIAEKTLLFIDKLLNEDDEELVEDDD